MKISKFQIITLLVFVGFLIAGVIAFATFKGSSSSTKLASITVWGTFPQQTLGQYMATIDQTLSDPLPITYVQKSPATFYQEFIGALANGRGPDAILVPADMLYPYRDKLAVIPFSTMTQWDYQNTYIQEANMYISSNGIYALPFAVDPLVMYWNRDMFDAAGISTYPKTWEEFSTLGNKLNIKDQNGNIRRSVVALGQFSNVDNAREILGTMLLQTGNPITTTATDGAIVSTLVSNPTGGADAQTATKFFAHFVDPANPDYSWNRDLPSSDAAFLSGSLATYFGFASELLGLRAKNQNLNFDVAFLPQFAKGVRANYARMYGFSLIRTSPNINSAYQIISTLTSSQYLSLISDKMYLPSVRRDIIGAGSNDPNITMFNQAALVAKAWPDVDANSSNQIFSNMVQSFTNGQKNLSQTIQDASNQYDILLQSSIPSI